MRVSKQSDFLGLFRFPKNQLDFWNFFFGFLAIYRERKSYRRSAAVKTTGCLRAFQISKYVKYLDFWISLFLDFLYLWPYLGNEKSYRRSSGVKTTGFLGLFSHLRVSCSLS